MQDANLGTSPTFAKAQHLQKPTMGHCDVSVKRKGVIICYAKINKFILRFFQKRNKN